MDQQIARPEAEGLEVVDQQTASGPDSAARTMDSGDYGDAVSIERGAAVTAGDPEEEEEGPDDEDLDDEDDEDLDDEEDDDDLEDEDLDDEDDDEEDEDEDDIDELDGDNDEEARADDVADMESDEDINHNDGTALTGAQSGGDAGVFGDPQRGVPGAAGDAAGDLERNQGSKMSDYLSNEDEIATGGATRLPPD